MTKNSIASLREKIAKIDQKILELLETRIQSVNEIKLCKEQNSENLFQPEIENLKRKNHRRQSGSINSPSFVLMNQIISLGRAQQTQLKIACEQKHYSAVMDLLGVFVQVQILDSSEQMSDKESYWFCAKEELPPEYTSDSLEEAEFYITRAQEGLMQCYPVI